MPKNNRQTLNEFLNTLDPNELVYLGTSEGHSWIMIDTVENVINSMDNLEKMAHDAAERELQSAIAKCYSIPHKILYLQEQTELEEDADEKEVLKDKLLTAERDFVYAFNTRKKCADLLKHWIVFGDRAVLDTYMKEIDDPGTCIVVEGRLNGTLWWKDEDACDEDCD